MRAVAILVVMGIVGVAAVCAIAGPAVAQSHSPRGRWLTEDHDGVIQIDTCGQALCGRIVGLTGFLPDGSAPVDHLGRSECRQQIIEALKETEAGIWQGEITNPEDGRRYNVEIWLDDVGRLHLRGYIGLPLFGQTQIWTPFAGRVTPDCHMT